MNSYLVTGQDLDEIHAELAGNGCQNFVAVADIHVEHCVRQIVGNNALNLDFVVFCQVINLTGCYFAVPGSDKPSLFVIRC